MPLFNTNTPVEPIIPTIPSVTPTPVINTASMYANMQHIPTIVGFLDGTPLSCVYYGQYLGEDDPAINSGDVNDPTLKQYLKIDAFEIRITSETTLSYDQNTGTSLVTGTANVYPVITPIVGDVFIALLISGSYGLFEVTAANRVSQFKESAWVIEYNQIDYLTVELEEELETHVVGVLQFDVTKLSYGDNPLLTKTEYNRNTDKNLIITNLVRLYYSSFYSKKADTFVLPNDGTYLGTMYDSHLVEFWNTFITNKQWLDGRIPPTTYDVTLHNVDAAIYTTWDAISAQSIDILDYASKNMERASTHIFNIPYQRHSLMVSDINYVVIPILKADKVATDITVEPNTINNSLMLSPYIFSLEFYNNTVDQSALEINARKLILKQVVNFTDLLPIVEAIKTAAPIVQFYHIPILIVLLIVSR